MIEILAKFHFPAKDVATVDAPGYVIIMYPALYHNSDIAGASIAYTSAGFWRCRLIGKGQCEKPRLVGRQQIQIPALFVHINNSTGESAERL